MAFSVTNIGTNSAVAGGATLAITVGVGGVPSGAAICLAVCERFTTGNVGTVADSASNTYTKITSAFLNNSAANGGGAIYVVNSATALVQNNTITYTRGTSGAATSISAFYVTGAAATPVDSGATNSATGQSPTSPSVTSGVPTVSNDLFIGAIAIDGNTGTFTQDSTNGAYATPFVAATSGTSAADSRVNGGNVVVSDGIAHTYAPTYSAVDIWAAFIIALKPSVVNLPRNVLQGLPIPPPIQPQSWMRSLNPELYSNPPIPAGQQVTALSPPIARRLNDYSWSWSLDVSLYSSPPLPAGARVTEFVRPPTLQDRSSTWFYYSTQNLPVGVQWTTLSPFRTGLLDPNWTFQPLSLKTPIIGPSKADPFRRDYLIARRKALKNIAKAEMERREYAWHQQAEERKKLRMSLLRSMYPDRYPPEIDEDEDERDIEFILLNL